ARAWNHPALRPCECRRCQQDERSEYGACDSVHVRLRYEVSVVETFPSAGLAQCNSRILPPSTRPAASGRARALPCSHPYQTTRRRVDDIEGQWRPPSEGAEQQEA